MRVTARCVWQYHRLMHFLYYEKMCTVMVETMCGRPCNWVCLDLLDLWIQDVTRVCSFVAISRKFEVRFS